MINDKGTAAPLRRRRDAALRLPPLEHLGVADPLDARTDPPGPSTFGLTPTELVAEARRLRGQGWGCWEVRVRLVRPELAGVTS